MPRRIVDLHAHISPEGLLSALADGRDRKRVTVNEAPLLSTFYDPPESDLVSSRRNVVA